MNGGATHTPRARVIGRWRVLRRLTVGGSSEVFIAVDVGDASRVVVLKLLLPHLAEDPTSVQAFAREVDVVRAIQSPFVAAIIDAGTWLGSPWMALEYVDGPDLAAVYDAHQGRGLSNDVLAAIGIGGALALAAVHEAVDAEGAALRLVHRDISPQNFVLARDGGLKLIDFGIARTATTPGCTETGVIKGKHAYMSPEQVRRAPLDARSDLFSFGVVLWELATGRRLFHSPTVIETLERIDSGVTPPVDAIKAEIHAELVAIIMACLAHDPAERPLDARSVACHFADWLDVAPPPVGGMCDETRALLAPLVQRFSVEADGLTISRDPEGGGP